ncbi:hypothetical protein NQZ68_007762 [Dissostichus eleginoides]|nr:hypothetical protein NQZ68_007762 [Dissostichus eleginoides]
MERTQRERVLRAAWTVTSHSDMLTNQILMFSVCGQKQEQRKCSDSYCHLLGDQELQPGAPGGRGSRVGPTANLLSGKAFSGRQRDEHRVRNHRASCCLPFYATDPSFSRASVFLDPVTVTAEGPSCVSGRACVREQVDALWATTRSHGDESERYAANCECPGHMSRSERSILQRHST